MLCLSALRIIFVRLYCIIVVLYYIVYCNALSSGQGKSMQFVDPDRIEQSDHVQAASFAPCKKNVVNNIKTYSWPSLI